MGQDLITIGSPTTTGGKVIKGDVSVTVGNKAIALIGDLATCMCGLPSCKKVGEIIAIGPRQATLNGKAYAKSGDMVNTGCGVCFLLPNSNNVTLGSITKALNTGSQVNFGKDVAINQ